MLRLASGDELISRRKQHQHLFPLRTAGYLDLLLVASQVGGAAPLGLP